MSTTAPGASRRSHTKSRNGCKTCKRRHIRCDETFPQCRNCKKHQVRCDYMDAVESDSRPQEPPIPELSWSPEIDSILDHWQRIGCCQLGDYAIDLRGSGYEYGKSDLHLIYHALWSGNNNMGNEYTIWTGKTPRFLEVATSQPFLVSAILGFGSLAVAWEKNSDEAKRLAYVHGSIALNGLQQAITTFSPANADAVLAASILLSWQANDWQSWARLVSGIQKLSKSMQSHRGESRLADILDEQDKAIPSDFSTTSRSCSTEDNRFNYGHVLQQIYYPVESLLPHLGRRSCVRYVEKLKDYIQRMLYHRAPQTSEEEFALLYEFRKWLLWIPATLLRSETRDYMTLVVLAYYYATAISFEPIFPNVASALCSTIALKPLEEILKTFESASRGPQYHSSDFASLNQLLNWPRQVMASFRHQKQRLHVTPQPESLQGFEQLSSDLATVYEHHRFGPRPSPAIGATSSGQVSCDHSSHGSPYLGVSNLATSSSSSYGSSYSHSPVILPSMSTEYHDMVDTFGNMSHLDWRGFVSPTPLCWT